MSVVPVLLVLGYRLLRRGAGDGGRVAALSRRYCLAGSISPKACWVSSQR